jgi:hypothetical protein
MILPDVNVLLYSFRSDSARHADYRAWMHSVVNGENAFGVSPQVLSSLVRIAAHLRQAKQPGGGADLCQRAPSTASLSGDSTGSPALADLLWSMPRSAGIGEPGTGRLARGAGDRIRLRVDHIRPGLRQV